MYRALLLVTVGIGVAAGGLKAYHDDHEDGEVVSVLSETDITEMLDGQEAKATVVEVTIEPGESGVPHRHPGPGFGYVLEGEYELGINDEPTRVLQAGETFYEPTGCLHRVSRNPGEVTTRIVAVVLHPRSETEIAVPESNED